MGTFQTTLFGGAAAAAAGTTTASQIVYTALRIAGVLAAPGRGYSGSEFGDGLDTLNALIESWNIEFGTIPAITRGIHALTIGQQAYTIGPGAVDYDEPRPSKIERASILIASGGVLIEQKMRLLDFTEWQQIAVKAVPSPIPSGLYYDRASPIGNINLSHVPSDASNQLALYVATTLSQIPDATTAFTLPPGYLRALEYGLAIELGPRFPGRATLSDLAIATAAQAKGVVMSLNCRSPKMRSDGDLSTGRDGAGMYNWLDGQLNDD